MGDQRSVAGSAFIGRVDFFSLQAYSAGGY